MDWIGFLVKTSLIYHMLYCSSLMGFKKCRENAGLLALTRVGSRRVIQISAGFMIFFSVFGRLA